MHSLYQLEKNDTNSQYAVFPTLEDWKNKIMFLETAEKEAGTKPEDYRKMIQDFKECGIFKEINGLIVGKPQDELYYDEFKKILIDELKGYNIPIIYNVNFGHALPRAILPINIKVSLDIESKSIIIEEEIFQE